ncbi:MAG: sugar phosphate nucleotidyltransferase, partial [Candidatus Heimdallarchaeota archaeon]
SKLDALCSIVVYPGKGERYGQLQVTADGRVLDIKEKIKSSEITDEIGYINAGIYLFERQIFQAIRDIPLSARGEYEITDAIALLGKLGVIGAVTTSPWISLEHPLDLLKAQSFLKPDEELLCMQFHSGGEIGFKAAEGIFFEKGPDFALSSITIKGPVLLGKGTLIETGSIIGPNAFIGRDCEIGSEWSVSNSLIMDNCRIGAKCQITNLICAEEILIGDKCIITLDKEKSKGISTLENYALIGGKTIISANVKLPQGIKIKAHSIVKDDTEIHSV